MAGLKRTAPHPRIDSEEDDFNRQSNDADADDEADRFHHGGHKRLKKGNDLGMMKVGGGHRPPTPHPTSSYVMKKHSSSMKTLKNNDQGRPQ